MESFHYIKFRSLCLWMLISVFILLLLSSIFPIFSDLENSPLQSIMLEYILMYILPTIWIYYMFKKYNVSMKEHLRLKINDYSFKQLVSFVLMLVLFAIGALWILFFPISIFKPGFVDNFLVVDLFMPYHGEWPVMIYNIGTVISIVLLAPIIEEVIFRGILVQRWSLKWGAKRAVLFSSLLFAVLHVDPIGAFVFGIVMSIIYIRTKSLFTPIILHISYNGFVIFIEIITIHWMLIEIPSIVILMHSYWWLFVLSFLLSTPLLTTFIVKNWCMIKRDNIPRME